MINPYEGSNYLYSGYGQTMNYNTGKDVSQSEQQPSGEMSQNDIYQQMDQTSESVVEDERTNIINANLPDMQTIIDEHYLSLSDVENAYEQLEQERYQLERQMVNIDSMSESEAKQLQNEYDRISSQISQIFRNWFEVTAMLNDKILTMSVFEAFINSAQARTPQRVETRIDRVVEQNF